MPSRRMPPLNFLLFSHPTQPHHNKPNHTYPRNLPSPSSPAIPSSATHSIPPAIPTTNLRVYDSKIIGQSGEGQTSRKIPFSALGTSSFPVGVVPLQVPGLRLYPRPFGGPGDGVRPTARGEGLEAWELVEVRKEFFGGVEE